MFSTEVTTFLVSWRGFLVGPRRGWHAHHRLHLTGYRGDHLVGTSRVGHQVQKVCLTLVDLFARGGTVWGFNLGYHPRRSYPWGQHYSTWRPGVLSNYFFCRLKRIHFFRRLRTSLVPPSSPKRSTFSKLSFQWVRLLQRGGLPTKVYRRGLNSILTVSGYLRQLKTGVACTFQPGGPFTFRSQPASGWGRTRWARQWWRASDFPGGQLRLSRRRRSQFYRPGLVSYFNHKVIHLNRVSFRPFSGRGTNWSIQRRGFSNPDSQVNTCSFSTKKESTPRRGTRVRTASPPGLQTSRYQQGLPSFPTVVVGGGFTLLGATLFHELSSTGTLLIYWGGPTGHPVRGAGLLSVLWNQSGPSLGGIRFLLTDLLGLATRAGLLRVVWGRLSS